MATISRSKVIKIGNSRGVRIPRTLLEQARLTDDIEMLVEDNQLIIRPARKARQGWDVQFARMAQEADDKLVDETRPTLWDESYWEW